MGSVSDTTNEGEGRPDFDRIARRIGRQLRDLYPSPEAEPIPAEHAQMLLELRQKERNTQRRADRF